MEDRFAPGGAERGELTGEVWGVDRDAGIAENRARILHQKSASKRAISSVF
jgi:hypothetical protein